MKKSQVKKCEPYKFLLDVTKKIKQKTKNVYFKIIFSSTTGQVKLLVAIGKNKNEAVNSNNTFFVFGNILSEKITSLIKVKKDTQDKAVKVNNAGQKDGVQENQQSSKILNKARRSVRFRKKYRRISRRSRLRRNRRQPLKDSITLKNYSEAGSPVPQSFNAKSAAITPKDFSSIFEDANSRLYDENQQPDIQIDNPPGVAKFIGLGVDIDRPSIIASTDVSPIIHDDTLDVYEQVILDRKLKLETIYRNLENVDTEDIEKLVETVQEYTALTEDALSSAMIISSLDEELVNEISVEMIDIANVLGFNNSLRLSQIYVQVLHDLGAIGIHGTYDTLAGVRRTSVSDNDINIDEYYHNFPNTSVQFGLYRGKVDDHLAYSFGSVGTLLGYYSDTDVIENRNNRGKNLATSGVKTKFSRYISNTRMTALMESIYYELMLSRLISFNDSNITSLKNSGFDNLVRAFLGQFSDPRLSLNEVKIPEMLAAIVKFNSSDVNYYPLEQVIPAGSGLNGRTFLDAVVQPAIGSIIEDQDPNFDLLNSWTEKTRSSLDSYFKYVDAAFIDGGSPIVYNEIVISIIKCITDKNLKIGSKKHPKSAQMEFKNNNLTSHNISVIFVRAFDEITRSGNLLMPHIYNTFGYSFFPGQDKLVKKFTGSDIAGLKSSNIDASLTNYCIGANNWKAGKSRAINDGEDPSAILNNVYQELSRFFNLLENNIMTSIDLLLADAGLINLAEAPDYNKEISGFFDLTKVQVQSPTADVGNSEFTKFSGIPRILIRSLLAICTYKILSEDGWWAFLPYRTTEKMVKAAKVSVENIDPQNGPVRWKVTHGQWPPDSSDSNNLSTEDYNNLVPEEVREARDGDVEEDMPDPTEGWEFIDSVEGFCPLTLMVDDEDNSKDNLSFVRANRALFDNHFDEIVTSRSRVYKMKHFLEKPLIAFQQFPEKLEDSVGKISLDSLKTMAELPGIDGQEIVKFTSVNQIGNMKKSLKLETPSVALRYLPNRYAIGQNEWFVAKRFIDDYMEKKFSNQEKTVVHSIGIPTGLLASEGLSNKQFSLTREAEYMFFTNHKWSAKLNKFHPSVYLIPGSFSTCSPNSSFNEIVNNTKYFIANTTMSKMLSYSEAKDYLGLTDNQALDIFTNHCIDYSLNLVLRITTGADYSEDTFRVNNKANNLFVSADGQKSIEALLKTFPSSYADIFKEDGIDSTGSILKKLSDVTVSEINMFLGSLDCRLISPEDMSKKILAPRIFDRVFNMFVHPDEHYTETGARGLKRLRKKIDGTTKNIFQIELKDGASNSVKNDHFASYYYRVEKL